MPFSDCWEYAAGAYKASAAARTGLLGKRRECGWFIDVALTSIRQSSISPLNYEEKGGKRQMASPRLPEAGGRVMGGDYEC